MRIRMGPLSRVASAASFSRCQSVSIAPPKINVFAERLWLGRDRFPPLEALQQPCKLRDAWRPFF